MDLSVNTVAKKQIVLVVCIAFIIMGLGFIIFRALGSPLEALPFSVGVIITSVFAAVKVKWLEAAVRLMGFIEGEAAQLNFIRVQQLLRFFATGAVLVGAVFLDEVLPGVLRGAVLGLLIEPFSKYGCYFLLKKDENKTEDGDE